MPAIRPFHLRIMGRRHFSARLALGVFCLGALAPGPAQAAEEFFFAEGTPYESHGFVIEGGVAGPTVLCIAAINHDDKTGAQFLEALRDVELLSGKLIVVPRYNIPSNHRGRSGIRTAFPKMTGDPIELDSAGILWDQLQELGIDYVIELERPVRNIRAQTKDRDDYGNTIFSGGTGESRAMMDAGLSAANRLVDDPERRWQPIRNPIVGLLVRSAPDELGVHAIRIIPSSQLEAEGERKEQVLEIVRAALRQIGVTTE